jgi:hypothetical protein
MLDGTIFVGPLAWLLRTIDWLPDKTRLGLSEFDR